MSTNTDKRERAQVFRKRLAEAMAEAGYNRSSLSRTVGVDRSTISQILTATNARLPNAQVVGECAVALGVSADWLLGLSARPERAGDIIDASLTVTEADRTSADAQIFDWHREAAGYKIRHVPATLPDFLKTEAVLNWEFSGKARRTPPQAIGAAQDLLGLILEGGSDFEIAIPVDSLLSFAAGSGYYDGLSKAIRQQQIDHILELHDRLFPTIRLFLFDAHRQFSAPMTVFGPLIGVIYLGHHYLAFREGQRIRTLSGHFDRLVRDAVVDARDLPAHLSALREAHCP